MKRDSAFFCRLDPDGYDDYRETVLNLDYVLAVVIQGEMVYVYYAYGKSTLHPDDYQSLIFEIMNREKENEK